MQISHSKERGIINHIRMARSFEIQDV